MKTKIFKFEIDVDTANAIIEADGYKNKEFREALIGAFGNQYIEIERKFDDAIAIAVEQYARQLELFLEEMAGEAEDE